MEERIYYGGDIITMEGKAADRMPEAVCVSGGRIKAMDSLENVKRISPEAVMIDLEGHTLMPAFIDAHSHFTGCASAKLQVPLDEAADFNEITERIQKFIQKNHVPKGEWVQGNAYDHNTLAEGMHPTREILDKAAPENPLIIKHQSGHMGVMNTLALKELGITEETPNPDGGVIGKENGRLTGYLEENALMMYIQKIPAGSLDTLMDAYKEAQKEYASFGITTVQEGMFMKSLIPLYKMLMERGLLKLDVVGYADMAVSDEVYEDFKDYTAGYKNHFRLGGYKIFLDGSPQGRTAWMRSPYAGSRDYKGYPTLSDNEVYSRVKKAATDKRQILAHCNGDAAAAQYINACEKVTDEMGTLAFIRPVIIHAQLLDRDQMPMVKKLKLIPSFFVGHVKYWGDVHRRNFGEERAGRISAAASALAEGIRFTFHQDAPVIEPNMLETIACAVNRITKSGFVLGPNERISVWEALKAVTINAAWQYFEEDQKGSISVGKRADLIILDENPLKVAKREIGNINVLETIKDGETIFKRQ